MDKTTEQAAQAMANLQPFKSGNTRVDVSESGCIASLYLFDSLIAVNLAGLYRITAAGYKTNTTKELLNGLPGVSINKRAGVWYLNGQVWNGEWVDVPSAYERKQIV